MESDENLLLHFDGGIRAPIASLQPRMLQIHLLCVRMLEVSFRTACPSFSELYKTLRQALCSLQSLTQPRQGLRYMSSGCRIMVSTTLILSSELELEISAVSCLICGTFF